MYHPMVYAVRTLHVAIGSVMTAATVLLWYGALFNVFNLWVWSGVGLLAVQWLILAFNHCDCPLGVVHNRYGDDKTLFELVAGKWYAQYGFRVWGAFCIVGSVLFAVRLLFFR